MIGETLGPYRIIEQIGAGGMATVFKAYEPGIDRYVALKLLPAQYYHDAQFRKRFEREARAVARLEHMNILPVYAYGEDRGHMYMAMRLMPWGTLSQRIRSVGALPFDEAARTLAQMASALDYAHSQGVLHRDVKPANILLDASGNAFLTDFGIARIVADSALTSSGVIMGTPAYMAPEQCHAAADVMPAADQYALGIILYEMLTGRVPFRAETPLAVVLMQLNDPLPLPSQFRPEMNEEIERVLLKALAKRPDDRFANCITMSVMFNQALAAPGSSVSREPASTLVEERLTSALQSPVQDSREVGTALPTRRSGLDAPAPTEKPGRRPSSGVASGWFWPLIGLALAAATLAALILLFGGNLAGLLGGTASEATATEVVIAPTACPFVEYRVQGFDTIRSIASAFEVSSEELIAYNLDADPDFDPDHMGIGDLLLIPQCAVEVVTEQVLARYPWSEADAGPGSRVLVEPCAWHGVGDGVCYFDFANGRLLAQVLEYRGEALSTAWSPDGTEIVIEGFGGDGLVSGLYIANVNGADIRQVMPPAITNALWPSWSPDGQWIAFHCSGDLCVVRPDGSDFEHISRLQCFIQPDWAADSRSIFVKRIDNCDGGIMPQTLRIERWYLDGTQHEELFSVELTSQDCLFDGLSLSPDGKAIYFNGPACANLKLDLATLSVASDTISPAEWADEVFTLP